MSVNAYDDYNARRLLGLTQGDEIPEEFLALYRPIRAVLSRLVPGPMCQAQLARIVADYEASRPEAPAIQKETRVVVTWYGKQYPGAMVGTLPNNRARVALDQDPQKKQFRDVELSAVAPEG